MRILVSHNNFPSQFRRLVPAWVAQGHDVVFLAKSQEWHAPEALGYRLLSYRAHRRDSGPSQHPYLRRLETAVIEGQAAYRSASRLVDEGWIPDVIINHVGFGNGIFLAELFPDSRKIGLFEWYYRPVGSDVDFLPPHSISADHKNCLKLWNTEMLHELVSCEFAVVPTNWQLSQFPKAFHPTMHVIHEGIDFNSLSNIRKSNFELPSSLVFDSSVEILTYVSRCFEEYRGFPQAIQAICRLQRERPNLQVLIVGQDCTAYGSPRGDGSGWSEWAKSSLSLDPSRTHWLGSLQYEDYIDILACSDVHLYLTVPFILSWSLLEAMAAGCRIVSSATPPVQEVLVHNHSALLVDFFNVESIVDALTQVLNDPTAAEERALCAQRAASRYRSEVGLAAWNQLLSLP